MENRLRMYLLISLCLLTPASLSLTDQESAFKIPDSLIQQLIKDINTNDHDSRLSKHDLDVLRKNLKCKLKDIDGDGAAEFFLYIDHFEWFGAGFNCDYWVYQKGATNYKLLLNEKQVRAKESKTNGYLDLVSETPMGVIAPDKYRFSITLYKYDGKQYRAVSTIEEMKTVKSKD
jgi:hypothetical protein